MNVTKIGCNARALQIILAAYKSYETQKTITLKPIVWHLTLSSRFYHCCRLGGDELLVWLHEMHLQYSRSQVKKLVLWQPPHRSCLKGPDHPQALHRVVYSTTAKSGILSNVRGLPHLVQGTETVTDPPASAVRFFNEILWWLIL